MEREARRASSTRATRMPALQRRLAPSGWRAAKCWRAERFGCAIGFTMADAKWRRRNQRDPVQAKRVMTGLVGGAREKSQRMVSLQAILCGGSNPHRSNALVQLSRLVLVIMGSTFDPDIFLVWCRERRADRRIVRGGHSIISLVLDLQDGRATDPCRVLRPLRVRQIVAPLRQPGAQRRIACEPRRRGVCGTRIAEITPTGPPSVRVDTRIEPADVAHRPMDDKAALDLTRP